MPIRDEFPAAGNPSYLGGVCDGWEYRIAFSSGSLQKTYDMLLQFLEEEGYGKVPVPANAEELRLFKIPRRNEQMQLFAENGYVHNPIKILFPHKPLLRNTLELRIYNTEAPQHLLRFHNRLLKEG